MICNVNCHQSPQEQLEARQREEAAREARAEQARRHAAWQRAVPGQSAKDLGTQSGDLAEDVTRSAVSVVVARMGVFQRVSTFLPAGFAEAWAAARTAIEIVNAGLPATPSTATSPASAPPEQTQELVRERLVSFYWALISWELTRHRNAVATARNEYLVWRMNQMPLAGTRFADRRPPATAIAPPPPTNEIRSRLALAQAASGAEQWSRVTADFAASTATADLWAAQMLPADAPERQAFDQASALHRRQTELLAAHADAQKIAAVFYPKDELTRQGGQERAVAFPWFFYLYRVPGEAMWVLEDLTAGKKVNTHSDTLDESIERVIRSTHGLRQRRNPPEDLWEQLNSKLRFPEGELHLALPEGGTYRLVTTAETTWAEYLGYAALAVGALAIVLVTAGVATPAAAAWIGADAAALGMASTALGLADLERQGMATGADRARAGLMIAVDLASILALGLGRVAAGAARAGEAATVSARLAGRLYVPVARLSAGLEITQLYVMTDDFVTQYRAIATQPGLTPQQREEAQRRIALFGLASGAVSLWSIRSTLRDAQRFRTISSDELLPPSTRPTGSAADMPASTVAGSAPRTTDLRLGAARMIEGAELDPSLAAGTINVQLRRNRWGLVSEIAVVHGPVPTGARAGAFAADLAHHQQIAALVQRYSGLLGEIRELFERLAAAARGVRRGPVEMELDLAKLEGRIQDRMRRLADLQYRGRLRLDALGKLWHGRSPLARTLRAASWAADRAAQILPDPDVAVVPIVAVHGAQVPWGKVVIDGCRSCRPSACQACFSGSRPCWGLGG